MVASGLNNVERVATELDRLSRKHYGKGLGELLADVETEKGRKQYARLIGVLIKEPFAIEVRRKPSKSTGAVYGLRWKDDADLRPTVRGSWQVEFIRELTAEQRGRALSDEEAYSALTDYKYESSLGKFVFEAFRDRICGDARTSKVVKEAIAQAKKAGISLTDPTTAGLSVGVASVVAVAVASTMSPALAAVASPVIGGIALLVVQTGVDGFCRWSRAVIESGMDDRRNADAGDAEE